MSTPPKSLLDSTFRYTNAASTDVRKTFAKVRARLRREQVALPGDRRVIALTPRTRKAK